MKKADVALREIGDFIQNLRLGNQAKVNVDSRAKSIYKLFQSLLLWQLAFDQEKAVKKGGFFDEFLSDSASAYFLALTSAYKPSAALLRSSIENLLRSLLVLKNVDVGAISTVWELFAKAKEAFTSNADAKRSIDALHVQYAELCKTTHSVSYEYMSLRIPFDKIFQHDAGKHTSASKDLKEVFRLGNEILYICNSGALNTLHHRASDAIRDVISPTIKASVAKAK